MSSKSRPWESLRAFCCFATHCRQDINQSNLEKLISANNDIIEIVGCKIKEDIEKEEKKLSTKFFTLFKKEPIQHQQKLMNLVGEEMKKYNLSSKFF